MATASWDTILRVYKIYPPYWDRALADTPSPRAVGLYHVRIVLLFD
jgi:hypothetical protein